jgi:hypothetical protein
MIQYEVICVNAMLREAFPNCDAILVDVSW